MIMLNISFTMCEFTSFPVHCIHPLWPAHPRNFPMC